MDLSYHYYSLKFTEQVPCQNSCECQTLFLKMGFGNESDDDLIVIEDGPKKNVLPTDKEIDEKLRIWVDDEVQKGNDPKDMKLMVLLKVKYF